MTDNDPITMLEGTCIEGRYSVDAVVGLHR
jgi:hypothetical protein